MRRTSEIRHNGCRRMQGEQKTGGSTLSNRDPTFIIPSLSFTSTIHSYDTTTDCASPRVYLKHAVNAAVARYQGLVLGVLAHVAEGTARALQEVGRGRVHLHAAKDDGDPAVLPDDFLEQRVVERQGPQQVARRLQQVVPLHVLLHHRADEPDAVSGDEQLVGFVPRQDREHAAAGLLLSTLCPATCFFETVKEVGGGVGSVKQRGA